MKKEAWLVKAKAVAKVDGFYSPKGELLKKARLTEAEVAEWNGVKPEPKVEEVVEAAVEETLVEIEKEETIIDKVVKKVRGKGSRKKK